MEESENEIVLEEEDEQSKNDNKLSQFDIIEVDQVEEEEIIVSYTRSGMIRR